ncbi:hypothetical protein ACFLU6_11690 [Acidobacteriota bacterium]
MRKKKGTRKISNLIASIKPVSQLLAFFHRKSFRKGAIKIDSLELGIEALSLSEMKVRARVSIVNQVLKSRKGVLYIGNSSVYTVSAPSGTLRWLHNDRYLAVRFPQTLLFKNRLNLQVLYKYYPNNTGGMVFPASVDLSFPIRTTVLHPVSFYAISQGRLVSEKREKDRRCTVWEHPRSHRLNLIFAQNVDRLTRSVQDVEFSLYIQKENRGHAEQVFDICIETYFNQMAQHGKLDYSHYVFIEADEKEGMDFNGRGLVAVSKGSFATAEEPRLLGILANELSKEWLA